MFTWKVNTNGRFNKGKVAGYINRDGYRMIGVGGEHYNAGKLAWFYVTGSWPRGGYADHRNLVRDDNRFKNLREATKCQNMSNRTSKAGKYSEFRGVTFNQKSEKWTARIQCDKRPIFLGYFEEELDAAVAYDRAAMKYHGEFARLNFPVEK